MAKHKTKISNSTRRSVFIIIGIVGFIFVLFIFFPTLSSFVKRLMPSFGPPSSPTVIIEEIRQLAINENNCEDALQKTKSLIKRESSNADAWYLKGVCEFELRRPDDARKSFQKAIALNPENEAVRTYLEILRGNIVNKNELSRDDFESLLGITVDSEIFEFTKAINLPINLPPANLPPGLPEEVYPSPGPAYSDFISATYSSENQTEDIIEYFRSELKQKNLSFDFDETSGISLFQVKLNNKKDSYVISIFSNLPVSIVIDFNRLK